jgi:type I restriction-modification system DNA methylase subunit
MKKQKDLRKEMAETFSSLSARNGVGQVFRDFLTMSMCALHGINIATNCQQKDEANEKLYETAIRPYKKEELPMFAKLLGIMQLMAHEYPLEDAFGDWFMENVSNDANGQFFTPTEICRLMARIVIPEGSPDGLTVSDPCCGSGRTLLAAAEINRTFVLYGADIDLMCCQMTCLNMLFNGLRGEVIWMDTIRMQFYGAWHINYHLAGIIPISQEDSSLPKMVRAFEEKQKTSVPPEFSTSPNRGTIAPQLTLF